MKRTIIYILAIFLLMAASAMADVRIYAEIVGGTVRAFHQRSDDKTPVFSATSGITVVEVTNADPMPAQKWKYDSKAGVFSEPDPPDPQVAIDAKIAAEMQSADSRAAAILRLRSKGGLPADYTEQAISGNVTPRLNGQ